MKIAILGAGNVGATLGRRFAEVGHEIHFGVPDPGAHADKQSFATVGSVNEAAQNAQTILLAVPYGAVADAVRECGNLANKLVIDATNPLRFSEGKLSLALGFETSGAETVAALATGAKVVKCFNQTGFGNMAQPEYTTGRNVMFVCGNDAEANETVRRLAESIGFDAVAAGDLQVARLLEPLAMLWIHLSMTTNLGRDFAFGLLRTRK